LSEDALKKLERLLEERARELSKRLEEFRRRMLEEGRTHTARRVERARKKILEYLAKR
jgi:hypothetical protein